VLSAIGKQVFVCLFCLPITDNTNFDIYGCLFFLFCLPITDNTNFDIIGKQNKQTKSNIYQNECYLL
jgi:hypothetical protein